MLVLAVCLTRIQDLRNIAVDLHFLNTSYSASVELMSEWARKCPRKNSKYLSSGNPSEENSVYC